MEPTKGETTFRYLVIGKDDYITVTLFREVNALNLSER